jgi:hypothetical protein
MPIRVATSLILALLVAIPAAAQDPDRQPVPAEPDFTLAALPTSLRMPHRAFAFRLTHRFSRPIAAGTVGDFFADLFGFDSSAQIGLELRYGLLPGTQVVVHRTNDKAIQFMGQHAFHRADQTGPWRVDVLGAVEGANNFQEDYAPTIGGILSYRFQEKFAVYAQPLAVFNAAFETTELEPGETRHSYLLGLGARLRLGSTRTYVLAEYAPRLGGYQPGEDQVSVGIERRAGGHLFQFNVSNSLGTTMRQIARGGAVPGDWYVGFNLTRKFY